MFIRSCSIKNFRCFEHLDLKFDHPCVLIEGSNGTGKTALLEALFYACFARSFRTPAPRECIRSEHEAFVVKVQGSSADEPWDVSVAFSPHKRICKMNGSAITSHKQILEQCKMILINANDLGIVQGYPDQRRAFIDTALILKNPSLTLTFAQYRHVLVQRNSWLKIGGTNAIEGEVWTHKLWELAHVITLQRRQAIGALEPLVQDIARNLFGAENRLVPSVQLASDWLVDQEEKEETYETFIEHNIVRLAREKIERRTLFGPHLDDLAITVENGRPARIYLSRGQQKVVALMLKYALIRMLNHQAILLVDDFFTDVDHTNMAKLFNMFMDTKMQLFLTSPYDTHAFFALFGSREHQKICLDNRTNSPQK